MADTRGTGSYARNVEQHGIQATAIEHCDVFAVTAIYRFPDRSPRHPRGYRDFLPRDLFCYYNDDPACTGIDGYIKRPAPLSHLLFLFFFYLSPIQGSISIIIIDNYD